MDREAWGAAVHGVAKSQTRLSSLTELNCMSLWTSQVVLLPVQEIKHIKRGSQDVLIPLIFRSAHPHVSLHFASVAQSSLTLCDPMDCSMPGFPVHHQLREFTQTHVHWVGDATNHLILCQPLLLPLILPSIRVFSNELVLCIRWPNYWSFSFNISPSSEHPGLISFRMDWLDLLAVQGTLKSLLQHHSSKTSSSELSFLYSPTLTSVHDYWKNIALMRRTFVGKVIS